MQCTEMIDSDNVQELFSVNRVDGLPNLIKWHLAVSHMCPAAQIANTVMTSIEAWPWQDLNDCEWRSEMTTHSWMLIAMLLRSSEFSSDNKFLSLFENLESDFQAAVKRSAWLSNNSNNAEGQLYSMAETIDNKLSTLEKNFIDWAVEHKTKLLDELKNLAQGHLSTSENALVDLARCKPDWFISPSTAQKNTQTTQPQNNSPCVITTFPIKQAM